MRSAQAADPAITRSQGLQLLLEGVPKCATSGAETSDAAKHVYATVEQEAALGTWISSNAGIAFQQQKLEVGPA